MDVLAGANGAPSRWVDQRSTPAGRAAVDIRFDVRGLATEAHRTVEAQLRRIGAYARGMSMRAQRKRKRRNLDAPAGEAPYSHETGGARYVREMTAWGVDPATLTLSLGPAASGGGHLTREVAPTLEFGGTLVNERRIRMLSKKTGPQKIFVPGVDMPDPGGARRVPVPKTARYDRALRSEGRAKHRGGRLDRGYLHPINASGSRAWGKYGTVYGLFRAPRPGTRDASAQRRNIDRLYGPDNRVVIRPHPYIAPYLRKAWRKLYASGQVDLAPPT